jgi:hypothetical protein
MKILIISVFSPDQYRTALCNTIFLSTVLNVHVPEFQIYGEDPEFIYDNVQLCALKISVLNYMFKVRYMYENSNFILHWSGENTEIIRIFIVFQSRECNLKSLFRVVQQWHQRSTLRLSETDRGVEISDLSTCPRASQNGNFTCSKKVICPDFLPYIYTVCWCIELPC